MCVCVCVCIGTFRDFLLYVLLLTPSEDSGRGHVSIVYMNTEVQETTLSAHLNPETTSNNSSMFSRKIQALKIPMSLNDFLRQHFH